MRPDLSESADREFKIRTFHGRRGRLSSTRLSTLEHIVPKYLVPLTGQQHDLSEVFNCAEIIVDFGCGMGGHAKQLLNDGKCVLAIDVHTAGIIDLADFAEQQDLKTLRLFHGDGKEYFADEIADHTITEVHVYFPDPWPKARHYKRRLISVDFLSELHRVLKIGGRVKIVTDIESYAELVREVIADPTVKALFKQVDYLDGVTMTSYHKRALRLGHQINKFELVSF